MRSVRIPTPADLAEAEAVVRRYLPATPLVERLKLESMQPTGSFKVRGALAALASRRGDVVTASAGNHGLGIAYAATLLKVRATIVVPTTASPAKIQALQGFDIHLVRHGATYDEAERHALELADRGAAYVSAYNDPLVIAGQATIAAEIREQVDGPVTIVAPVGGGGLVAGLSLWAAQHDDMRVVGVQARASRAVSTAVERGRIVDVEVGETLADGLAGNIEPGCVTPAIIAKHTAELLAVDEADIRWAMRHLAARHGLVAEGSAAVTLAALRHKDIEDSVAIITGRNVTLPTLTKVLAALDEQADPV